MMKKFLHSRRGFTMMEMMIVLTIIGIIMAIGVLPYGEYMKRARLGNSVDLITQEWVLAHKEVRNGIIFPEKISPTSSVPTEPKNASILFHFEQGNTSIKKYLFSGTGGELLATTVSDLNLPDKFLLQKEIFLENNLKIQKIGDGTLSEIFYFIEAPFAEGKFYNNFPASASELSQKSEKILIEYDNFSPNIKRGEILLRPYLQ